MSMPENKPLTDCGEEIFTDILRAVTSSDQRALEYISSIGILARHRDDPEYEALLLEYAGEMIETFCDWEKGQ